MIEGTVNGSNNGCYVNSVAAQTNCWMQGTMRGSTINSISLMLRCSTVAASGYLLQFFSGAPQIARFDAGAYTALITDATLYAAGTVIYFEAVGNVLTAKANGATILTYDTTPDGTKYASGRFGLYSFADNTGLDTITAGDFSGGSSPSGAVGSLPRLRRIRRSLR